PFPGTRPRGYTPRLGHHTHAGFEGSGIGDGVQSQDSDTTTVGTTKPLADLDGAGLARTVGSQKGGHRTLTCGERQARDGGGGAVSLDQVDDLDRGCVHGSRVYVRLGAVAHRLVLKGVGA